MRSDNNCLRQLLRELLFLLAEFGNSVHDCAGKRGVAVVMASIRDDGEIGLWQRLGKGKSVGYRAEQVVTAMEQLDGGVFEFVRGLIEQALGYKAMLAGVMGIDFHHGTKLICIAEFAEECFIWCDGKYGEFPAAELYGSFMGYRRVRVMHHLGITGNGIMTQAMGQEVTELLIFLRVELSTEALRLVQPL